MDGVPQVGQLVISRAGRDAGRPMVVVAVCDTRHVLVVDGRLRPGTRPKRKNVRHLAPGGARHQALAAGGQPDDAEIRGWLAEVTGMQPGLDPAQGEGQA